MSQSLNRKNDYLAQSLSALLAVILCLAAVVVYWNVFAADTEDVEYPLKDYVANYNPFIQQFDAFEKGQTWIDWEADPRLDELKNVYDYQERSKSGIYYLWDRTYYEGRFYSYFGIAPVITVYYPYYLINGTLPGTGYVMTVFCVIAAIFMPLCIFQWAWNFARKTPHWVLLFAAPALFWGSLIMLIARGYTPFYYVVCVAGSAFLSVFLWACLRAYSEKKLVWRCVLYALAGIAYGLTLQSRINVAFLAAFLVLPGLWFLIIRRERKEGTIKKIWEIFIELASLGIPVCLFFCGTMIFNSLRFSGPFDFGYAYQLTVCDTNILKFRLSDAPYAYFHYFFDMPRESDVYPYVTMSYVKFNDYGHYVYKDAALGMFAVPLMIGLFAAPAVIFSREYTPRRRIFTACALAGILVLPVMDFGRGGVIYRYTCDFTLVSALFSEITLISIADNLREKKSKGAAIAGYVLYGLIIALAVFSVIVCIRLCLINGNGNVNKYSEEISSAVEKLLPFKPKEIIK